MQLQSHWQRSWRLPSCWTPSARCNHLDYKSDSIDEEARVARRQVLIYSKGSLHLNEVQSVVRSMEMSLDVTDPNNRDTMPAAPHILHYAMPMAFRSCVNPSALDARSFFRFLDLCCV